MIYIIISNIGLALITLVMYIRYSHFRISSNLKIRELDKKLKAKKEELKTLDKSLRAEIKEESGQVKSLLREVEQARKERQEEIEMRLEAEKQIELAVQKIEEVQARVDDWRVIQDETLQSSRESFLRFGDDLLAKISSSTKRESDESRHFIEENMRGLQKYISGIEAKIKEFQDISRQASKNVEKKQLAKGVKSEESDAEVGAKPAAKTGGLDEVAKKSLQDVVSLMEVSEMKHLKDYVLAQKLDEKKAKYMLCELAYVKDDIAYLIDFKSNRYFKDYESMSEEDKKKNLPAFKKKIDKYIAYISNPKYSALTVKLLKALNFKFKQTKTIFALRNYDDLSFMDDLKYREKCEELKIEVRDVNGVNDLVL